MPPELAQWIPPAVIVGVMLYLHRVTRQDMKQMESRLSGRIEGVESKIENLRDRMDLQNGELRERMARIEGTLDVIREYFVGNRRAVDRAQPEMLVPPRESAIALSREETRTHRQPYH